MFIDIMEIILNLLGSWESGISFTNIEYLISGPPFTNMV